MHNPETALEKETHKILWDFVIQVDHLISARRLDHVIVSKKKVKREPTELADHRVKLIESEKRDKYLNLARELKKIMERESDGDINCNWRARYSYQRLRNQRTSRDHLDYSITARILRRVLETL